MKKIKIKPFNGTIDEDFIFNLQSIGLNEQESETLAELIINNSGHGSYIKAPDAISKQSLIDALVRSGFEAS